MSRQHCRRLSVFAIFTLFSFGAVTACDADYEDEGPAEEEQIEREETPEKEQAQAETEADAAAERFAEVDIGELVANPGEYEGQQVMATAPVQEVPSDNLFFVGESDEQRLLAGFGPDYESPEDVTVGMRVGIRGEMMTPENAKERIAPGLGEEARTMVDDQEYIFVVTEAGGIEVVERAGEGETAPEEEIAE